MKALKEDAGLVEEMACAMWIDYAAGGGVRATAAHWREDSGEMNERSKDGFRRSARVALKVVRKAEGVK